MSQILFRFFLQEWTFIECLFTVNVYVWNHAHHPLIFHCTRESKYFVSRIIGRRRRWKYLSFFTTSAVFFSRLLPASHAVSRITHSLILQCHKCAHLSYSCMLKVKHVIFAEKTRRQVSQSPELPIHCLRQNKRSEAM